MKYLAGLVLFLGLVATGFGQVRGPYGSLGGFGNVVYPGTGHQPHTPPGGITGPYFFGNGARGGGFGGPVGANHPFHGRSTIVPYPVLYGGYGYGYPGYGYGFDPSGGDASAGGDQAPPVINSGSVPPVIINQSFVPQQVNPQVREYNPDNSNQQQGMTLYQNSSHPYADAGGNATTRPQAIGSDDQPTIYLIAFKDHTIVQALGYWMEGSTLHYVSAEHSLNQASIDLIDRDLSQRLNSERGLDFRLPAAR